MQTTNPTTDRGGLAFALGAYGIWGLFPLYLMTIRHVPPLEFVGWRVVLTLPVCIVLLLFRSQFGRFLHALGNPRAIGILCASAAIIAVNWLIYVTAVQTGHVFAASLGYYINPLVNVLAGTVFLRERLSRLQWFAVAVAAMGVLVLAWGAHEMLGISMTLAISFAAYGLLRKLAPVESLPGLAIESLILLLPAAGLLVWQSGDAGHLSFGTGLVEDSYLAMAGIVTATPLLLFAAAARRMDYSTLGFVQYLAPTLVFLLGLFLFEERLRTIQLVCFVFIWIAIAIYSFDIYWRRRKVAA